MAAPFKIDKLLVIGVGLIGGSVALALRKAGGGWRDCRSRTIGGKPGKGSPAQCDRPIHRRSCTRSGGK